jgi:hypothetical protein
MQSQGHQRTQEESKAEAKIWRCFTAGFEDRGKDHEPKNTRNAGQKPKGQRILPPKPPEGISPTDTLTLARCKNFFGLLTSRTTENKYVSF